MKVHPVDALLELAKRFNLGELDSAMLERWRVLLNTPHAAQVVNVAREISLEGPEAERAILAVLSRAGVRDALAREPLDPPLSLARHGLRFAVKRSVCPFPHPDGRDMRGDEIPTPAHVLGLELGVKWAPHAGLATISLTCGECRRVSERRIPLEWDAERDKGRSRADCLERFANAPPSSSVTSGLSREAALGLSRHLSERGT